MSMEPAFLKNSSLNLSDDLKFFVIANLEHPQARFNIFDSISNFDGVGLASLNEVYHACILPLDVGQEN
jgi:hypothetical protein